MMMTTEVTLTNSIKVERAKQDLTQAQLASKAGITRRSVNAIETGRMVPSVLLALRIARALDVSIESLFALRETLPDPTRLYE
ncbi:MAG TPA: helix-turn-helix transcriptional regulator [Thermoanaerobaculia bacterium]